MKYIILKVEDDKLCNVLEKEVYLSLIVLAKIMATEETPETLKLIRLLESIT